MLPGDESMSDIRHPTVPKKYAGKWIAWDHSMTRIVASGTTTDEVLEAAKKAGETDPILDKVPLGILRPWRYRMRRVQSSS